ncbi:nitroreductase [Oikeobacillus pervagus]|uniref:Putative NAD(P)H nitroreductase n=1 Tax=Oikeobacillus pervagus TaxID=1325931 RepID=A0AAJ1WJX2_9BACI|nr:nitroreductase [Oikeobacillus pervagus]MDQ0215928.1 nitroreductase [Oikeobacillus pervagus]
MSIKETIRSRRSIKQFNGEPVSEKEVLSVLEDAVWAPNHGVREPWRFVVAADDGKARLLDILKEQTIGPKWKDMQQDEVAKAMQKFTNVGAFVFVIVPEDARQKERLEDFAAASALIQNAQLLAWEMGIGTCWKTPVFLDHPKFREALHVHRGERIVGMLQFGHFDIVPKGKERTPIEEKITRL